jgi:hypothetical protein
MKLQLKMSHKDNLYQLSGVIKLVLPLLMLIYEVSEKKAAVIAM